MNLVMWVLVAVLAVLVAGFVMKRGYGRGWDIVIGLVGSVAVGWFFQSQWAAPAPSLMAVTLVAAVGATGLIIAQRTIFPAHAPSAQRTRADIRPTS
jgi:uncharacterized membrane protein YeaQ/YmgE (transglycosylase-associated protein family)